MADGDKKEMDKTAKCGCVLLAAGLGRRFGGDKLHAEVDGQSMIHRAMDAVPVDLLAKTAVVSGDPAILYMAEERGFIPVSNQTPHLGISHSVRLGLRALGDCELALFMVSDQPKLRRETVARAMETAVQNPDKIVALSWNGQRGNPCVFPAEFFPELLALSGDRGGGAVAERHPSRLLLVEAEREELADVDDREALDRLNASDRELRIKRLHPRITVRFYTEAKCFGPGIVQLLSRVQELGSLRASAISMTMSYSKAWSIVRQCENALGWPLLVRATGGKHGGGATLTDGARKLLSMYEEYCRELDDMADRLLEEKMRIYFTDEERRK